MAGGHEPQREPADGNAHDIYSSDEAVEFYTHLAREIGLFPQERQAIERYFRQSGGSVLDVGCGTGRVANRLDELGFDVTGIDISEPLVEVAREQFPHVDFRVADVTESELPAQAFDYAVFGYNGLDTVLPKERRLEALRELYRVLRPGGILVFSSHNTWNLLPSIVLGNWDYVEDLYFTQKNFPRLFSRTKIERMNEGDTAIYISNPLHQWLQLRSCGFTLLDVIGQGEGIVRFFVRQPYYVAKK